MLYSENIQNAISQKQTGQRDYWNITNCLNKSKLSKFRWVVKCWSLISKTNPNLFKFTNFPFHTFLAPFVVDERKISGLKSLFVGDSWQKWLTFTSLLRYCHLHYLTSEYLTKRSLSLDLCQPTNSTRF